MSVAQFQVLSVGPQVSFQDAGRAGHLRFGITASGPMDALAYAAGQAALGYHVNKVQRTSVEVSIGGLSLKCTHGQTMFSVAGGEFQVLIDGTVIPSWCLARIQRGQTLTIKPGRSGSWCYLAFAGELQTSSWLGYSATNANSGLGGGLLRIGQTIHVTKTWMLDEKLKSISQMDCLRSGEPFRIVIGPQEQYFKPETIMQITDTEFKMSAAYDRMGAKLTGPQLELTDALSIPSEPIIRGSIQVAGDGQPTVLLADHQASGGYPKIATMIGSEIDRFVQMRAPAKISFETVTPAEAIDAARIYEHQKSKYLDRLLMRCPSPMTELLRQAEFPHQ